MATAFLCITTCMGSETRLRKKFPFQKQETQESQILQSPTPEKKKKKCRCIYVCMCVSVCLYVEEEVK